MQASLGVLVAVLALSCVHAGLRKHGFGFRGTSIRQHYQQTVRSLQAQAAEDVISFSEDHYSSRSTFALRNCTHHELHFPANVDFRNTTSIAFTGPSSHHKLLEWHDPPKRILFLAKPDYDMMDKLYEAVLHLWSKDVDIIFEETIFNCLYSYTPFHDWFHAQKTNSSRKRMSLFHSQENNIDLVITFGGDGLLLHCNQLFNGQAVPPVMCFDFGSLGFLTPFQYEHFETEIESVLRGSVQVTLRMRLECTIFRGNLEERSFTVLNEAVVDRGPSPFLSVLDLTCNEHYLTTLQGDGMIFATPTGSTAYSLSAGGGIVYPSVPAILLTPVCAHSLSFRPMLLPDSAVLSCDVPLECRASAWVSFDGKHRQELHRGDRLRIRMSAFPLPTIQRKNHTEDWFDSLRASFMFNLRPRQKATI